jgi:hypothetical protein
VSAANSLSAASDAALIWLANKGIRSQEELPKLYGARIDVVSGQVERLSKGIAGALRNKDLWTDHTPAEFAIAIVKELTFEQAKQFRDAVNEAFETKESR